MVIDEFDLRRLRVRAQSLSGEWAHETVQVGDGWEYVRHKKGGILIYEIQQDVPAPGTPARPAVIRQFWGLPFKPHTLGDWDVEQSSSEDGTTFVLLAGRGEEWFNEPVSEIATFTDPGEFPKGVQIENMNLVNSLTRFRDALWQIARTSDVWTARRLAREVLLPHLTDPSLLPEVSRADAPRSRARHPRVAEGE